MEALHNLAFGFEHALTIHNLMYCAIGCVVGTLVGFMLYAWLLRVAPTPLVSTYAFANPVVALLLGWGIEHERLTARTLGAAVLIVGAVALIIVSQALGAARTAETVPTAPAATLDP